MINLSLITRILSLSTLAANLFLIAVFLVWLYQRGLKQELAAANKMWGFVRENGLALAFLVALAATLGSLFYSEAAGFAPCELCWYQRIFMYPQVVILGAALVKKTNNAAKYAIVLSLIGGLISVYHYYLQKMAVTAPCSLDNVDCGAKYIFHFGYITISIMALTAFVLIILFAYAQSQNANLEKGGQRSHLELA